MAEDIASLVLVGGNAALDLVNTIERGIPRPASANQDFLAEPADLLVWAERVELISASERDVVQRDWRARPAQGQANLRAVLGIRESLHTVLLASVNGARGSDPLVAPALETVMRHWLESMRRSRLDASGPEAFLGLRVGAEASSLPVDRVSAAVFDLVRSDDMLRLRRCPVDEGGCGWMFIDRTRNGSRRWCRMADCGTQVKSRRLTERRRDLRHLAAAEGDDDG